jgi:hypothetical protein
MGMETKQQAQDKIILAIVNEAFVAEDHGNLALAIAIRTEGVRLAKRYGISDVHGLPGTWPKTPPRRRGYRGL